MAKYKALKINGIKYDEHRYIMEQKLGRKLDRKEVVHHINGDSTDNRLENLEVMSLSDHTRLHQKGHIESDSARRSISEKLKGRPNLQCRMLSNDDVEYIKKVYIPRDKDFGIRPLSRKFGISHSSLSRIINNKSYKNIK